MISTKIYSSWRLSLTSENNNLGAFPQQADDIRECANVWETFPTLGLTDHVQDKPPQGGFINLGRNAGICAQDVREHVTGVDARCHLLLDP